MTFEQLVDIANAAAWAMLCVSTLPGTARVFRNKIKALDPIQCGLFFLSAAQLNLLIIKIYYSVSIWQRADMIVWAASFAVLILTVFTLIILIRKTDAAVIHT